MFYYTKISQNHKFIVALRAKNFPNFQKFLILHRCWWRILESKCFGDNFKIFRTVLVILVTNIHHLFTFTSGTNIQKISPTPKFGHQHPQFVTYFQSPTSLSPFDAYDRSFNWHTWYLGVGFLIWWFLCVGFNLVKLK